MLSCVGGVCRYVGITHEECLDLGRVSGSHDFNMTALAIQISRSHNGVSKIHRNVSARICSDLWPQVEPQENPMAYVTNGVHVPTFLAQEWLDLFDRYLGYEWRHNMSDTEYWSSIDTITVHLLWNVFKKIKSQTLNALPVRVSG